MKRLEERSSLLEQLERTSDGRNIDPRRGVLMGEAASQRVKEPALANPAPMLSTTVPSRSGSADVSPSYYGMPAIKSPVWLPTIPLYFYVGGLAGAASALGTAVELFGGHGLTALKRRCRWLGFAGDMASTGLLVQDLGRPERFLHMLRMFRPTSPMSMGAWLLSASATMNGASVAAMVLGRPGGGVEKLGNAASLAAGVLGMPLAGYTAVLLSNTSVPVWQRTRRTLPLLFMTSAMTSAASLLELLPQASAHERRVVRRFGAIGKAGALAAGVAVEQELSVLEELSRPLKQGRAGTLWRTARLCTVASLALDLLPGRQRWKQLTASALGTMGALATRYAIYEAGKVSTRDPHATFVPQRHGLGAAEVVESLGPATQRASAHSQAATVPAP
ncbi:polysulfide reductase NrfD [Myxococcaceae bacterium GXIMD 01537]